MLRYLTLPVEKIHEIVARHPVTMADLDVIRDPRQPSHFVGVYEKTHKDGTQVFLARVHKYIGFGTQFASKNDAGRAVVAWYKELFGPHRWIKCYKRRKSAPWRIVDVTAKCVWSLRPDMREVIGHRAEVFVRGVPVVVTLKRGGSERAKDADAYLWESADVARERAKRFAAARGEGALVPGMVLWRA